MSLIGVMLLLLSLAFLNIMFSIVGVKGFLSRYSSIILYPLKRKQQFLLIKIKEM